MKRLPLFRSLIGATLLCAGALTFCAAIAVGTQGQVAFLYLVNTTSDAVVLGACQNGDAGCSLRDAIQTANAHPGPDGIVFDLPAGSVINLTKALPDITDSVNINGPGADKLTINGNSAFRIFNVTTSGTVSLSGITLENGTASNDNGGGIQNFNAGTVNVTNCVLRDSANAVVAVDGGGIYNRGGGVINITSCTFFQIPASNNGGGIYNSSSGTITLKDSTL